MKRFYFMVVFAVIMITSVSASAISANNFDGSWLAETVVVEGIALPADKYEFDMNMSILDTPLGTIVEVKSNVLGLDTRELFSLIDNSLVLENTARIDYVDDNTVNLFIAGDTENTYTILTRSQAASSPAEKKSITGTDLTINNGIIEDAPAASQVIEISDSAKDIIVSGTNDVVISDWGLLEGQYNNQLVLALTNVSDETIPNIELQIVFYDSTGNIIGNLTDGHDVVLPGSTVVTSKSIFDDSVLKYASAEVIFDTERYTNDYVNHANNLAISDSISGNNVFLQVINNDMQEIAEIEIVVVFYKNNSIVGADEDQVTSLASGAKHVFEFNGYEECGADSFKYFINQAHTW